MTISECKDRGDFGVLTLATAKDYQKAIGLALSIRVSNPGIQIAVACEKDVRKFVSPYFDHVIDQDPSLHRFEHKLYLDRYSPFGETFYFDADVLVFRPLTEALDRWRRQSYAACGSYSATGTSAFGLKTESVLTIIGHERLVRIDGAGHAYFRKPDCISVFDLARKVASDYSQYAGDISLADEDVMNIVMTILGLEPIPHVEFWSLYCSGKPGTIRLNAAEGECVFEVATTGDVQRPYMMHFAAREAPLVYAGQLRRLFRKFNVPTKGMLAWAVRDFYIRELLWPAKRSMRHLYNHLQRQFGGR